MERHTDNPTCLFLLTLMHAAAVALTAIWLPGFWLLCGRPTRASQAFNCCLDELRSLNLLVE